LWLFIKRDRQTETDKQRQTNRQTNRDRQTETDRARYSENCMYSVVVLFCVVSSCHSFAAVVSCGHSVGLHRSTVPPGVHSRPRHQHHPLALHLLSTQLQWYVLLHLYLEKEKFLHAAAIQAIDVFKNSHLISYSYRAVVGHVAGSSSLPR